MRILSADDVRQALPMRAAIEGMKQAYAAFSADRAQAPQRTHLKIGPADALFMPAAVESPPALAVKAVTVYPQNPERNLPLIHAAVLVFDPQTGQAQALLEGGALTAIRTGAGSGAATDLLARPESRIAAVFGAGVQARTQLEAVCTVRPIEQVWIYDTRPEAAARMAQELSGQPPFPADIRVAASPREAVSSADIICTATTAANPVFEDEDLKPGVHINAIGAYRPDMREVPPETLHRARLFVDSFAAVQQEAGDLLFAMECGLLSLADMDELGDLINGTVTGRNHSEEITVFKSVGLAVQDAVAAQIALENARKNNLGMEINF